MGTSTTQLPNSLLEIDDSSLATPLASRMSVSAELPTWTTPFNGLRSRNLSPSQEVFSEAQIDHSVMAITSAEATAWHTAPAPALNPSRRGIMSMGAPLYALIGTIKRSPIVVRLSERLLHPLDWASVRKLPDVDAYVLAWIASHSRTGIARRARLCLARCD